MEKKTVVKKRETERTPGIVFGILLRKPGKPQHSFVSVEVSNQK